MNTQMNRTLDNIHLIFSLFNRTLLKPEDLTHNPMSPEFRVLLALMMRDSQPISAIGRWLGISKSNMTAVIDKLTASGYIEKKSSKRDRRIIDICLTVEGKCYMEMCKTEARESVKKRLSVLSNDDLNSLSTSLENIRRILMNLTGMNNITIKTLEKALQGGIEI